MWQEPSLQMEWCLDCHRHPERYVRPREQVFNMDWQPPARSARRSASKLVKEEYDVETPLTSCSTCHR